MAHSGFKNIVVPVDLSETSVAPLRYASMFAQQFKANVIVMYADRLATFVRNDEQYLDPHIEPTAESSKHEDELREFAAVHLTGVTPEIVVLPGHPVATIVEVANDNEADLIIMGTHGHRGWRHAFAGSVADGVIRRASQPVLIAPMTLDRRASPEPIRRIVCPVNFTVAAHGAVEYAAVIASAFNAELVLVNVIESGDTFSEISAERVRQLLPDDVATRCSVREIVIRGGASERVLDCVEDEHAELLVMGVQLKSLRNEPVIGTTAERLMRFATVPVLAVTRKAVRDVDVIPQEDAFADELERMWMSEEPK